ncbi:hypothetical protein COCNU_scaffold000110G000100 [Cocos nucifera]|nr:hypothetical protein [Cocos nucifera]
MAKEYKVEVEHLKETHSAKVEYLQEALKRDKQASVELKAALALEEKKRKKAKAKIVEERRRVAKAEGQAILSFKSLKELEGIKVEFTQVAFGKGFNFCQKKLLRSFSDWTSAFCCKILLMMR